LKIGAYFCSYELMTGNFRRRTTFSEYAVGLCFRRTSYSMPTFSNSNSQQCHKTYTASVWSTQPLWIRSRMDYGERDKTRWASSWTNRSAWPYRPHFVLKIFRFLRNRCRRSW